MRRHILATLVAVVVLGAVTARPAAAQKACDFLLPPSGGSFEILVHPAYVTSVRFSAKLGSAKTSDLSEYELRPDGDSSLLVRPKTATAQPANINAQVGGVPISVNLRTVADSTDACALVLFKATTEQEARDRAVADAVAAQTAALKAELAAVKRDIAARVRAQIDAEIAARTMARLDLAKLNAVDRNDAGVVAWVLRAVYLGDAVLVNVEIENRSRDAFLIAALEVRDGNANRATAAFFAHASTAPGVLGTVASGAKLRGVVVVPDARTVGRGATLVVRGADAGTDITVSGLGLR